MVVSQTTSITPSAHASRHSVGGTDPLVNPLLLHSSRHGEGGDDVINIYATTDNTSIYLINDTVRAGRNVAYAKEKESLLTTSIDEIIIHFELKATHAVSVSARIYQNGVAVGTVRTTSAQAFQEYEETLSGWSDGDLLQIYAIASGAGDHEIKNLRILGGILSPFDYTNQDP